MNYKPCSLKDIYKSRLAQALLAKAFRGELVEQLPSDGDARELVEEICKAKAGLEKAGEQKRCRKTMELGWWRKRDEV